MATKRFLLTYPDGSSAYIKASERDELLIAGQIAHLDTFRYKYTAQPRTFHSFADLQNLRPTFKQQFRRYLPGSFIIERNKRRERELLETAEGLAIRLQTA